MSGQPDGTDDQGGQGGQSSGGQSQDGRGGQPQGGQQRGGQPQGGRQPGEQPQGGQPTGGQPQAQPQGAQPAGSQPQAQGRSYQTGGEQELIKEWTVFTALLFAISGAAVGLMIFLIDAIDQDLLSVDGGGFGGGGLGFNFLFLIMYAVVAVSFAAFVGAVIASQTDEPDQTAFKLAAAGTGAGTILFFVIGSVLTSLTFADGVSLAFGGVIINGIIAGLAAAGAGVGGVWTMRNQSPL